MKAIRLFLTFVAVLVSTAGSVWAQNPDAVDDMVTTDEETVIEIDVLDNDTDPEGDPLTVIAVGNFLNGTAQIINNGNGATQVRFSPSPGFSGTASFTYTIDDGNGNTDQAMVTVTVNDTINEAPFVLDAIEDQELEAGGETFTVDLTTVFSDPNGDDLTFMASSSHPDSATVSIDEDELTVTGQRVGTTTITVTATDPDGESVTDMFLVTVEAEAGNRAPQVTTPISDQIRDEGGQTFVVNLSNVFADPDTDMLFFSASSSNQDAATTSITSTTLTVTTVESGLATITVRATDPSGAVATDAFTIRVLSVTQNNAPFATNAIANQSLTVNAAPFNATLTNFFTDPDGDPLTFDATTTDARVAAVAVIGNTLTVSALRAGMATVEVTATDPGNASASTSFVVTVTGQGGTFTAMLSGANEVPANSSRATGMVTVTINGNQVVVTGSFSGLESDYNTSVGSHLHLGYAGQNGNVVFALTPTLTGSLRAGTFEAANNTFALGTGGVPAATQLAAFRNRQYYVNIHTDNLPAGEIRGQLIPNIDETGRQADAVLRSVFSGRAEVPFNFSQAVGGAVVELRGNTAIVSGAFSGLESNFNGGAHLHRAGLGENGDVSFALTPTSTTGRSSTFVPGQNTFALTAEQVQAFRDGEFYINIHTVDLPGGEVRGQVLPKSSRVLEAALQGSNEVSPVMTDATGALLAVLDDSNQLTVSGSFQGLESDFASNIGAHLHLGAVDANGNVVFALAPTLANDERSGTFKAEDNVFALSQQQALALLTGGFYVNVHSDEHPRGEIRGQVLVSTNVAPEAAEITTPADDAEVDIMGNPATPLTVDWDAAVDPNGNPVFYRWQLALDDDFDTVVIDTSTGTASVFSTTFGIVGPLLTSLGVELGGEVTLYHRLVTSDGSFQTPGEVFEINLTRNTLTDSEDATHLPASFALQGNYPNPFNTATTILFDLDKNAEVRIEVLDLLGREVLTVPARSFVPGAGHAIEINASTLGSGVYLYRVVAQSHDTTVTETGRMLLLK